MSWPRDSMLDPVFLLFGYGVKRKYVGAGETRTCPRCHNTTQWARMRQFTQFTVFLFRSPGGSAADSRNAASAALSLICDRLGRKILLHRRSSSRIPQFSLRFRSKYAGTRERLQHKTCRNTLL